MKTFNGEGQRMWILSLYGNRARGHRRSAGGNAKPAGRAKTRRLHVELLEERRLLSLSPPTAFWFTDVTAEVEAEFVAGETRVEVQRETEGGVSGGLSLPGVVVETVSAQESDFTRLKVPGWNTGGEIGQAGLPIYCTAFAVPNDVEVEAEYTAESTASFRTDLPLYPVQSVDPAGSGSETGFSLDEAYYDGATSTQTRIVTVSEPAIARGTSLVFVEIAPFQYDPLRGEISVVTDLTFSLSFEEAETPAVDLGGEASTAGGYDTNPLLTNGEVEPAAAEADYLIIVPYGLYPYPVDEDVPEDPIDRLAEWKQQKGFKTHVLRLPNWDDYGFIYEDQVRQYISKAYHTGNRLSYVLLVGDSGIDLGPRTNNESLTGYTGGDQKYACVDPDPYESDPENPSSDFLPDLTLGRLPLTRNQTYPPDYEGGIHQDDLEHPLAWAVENILRYDRHPDNPNNDDSNWYKRALVAGYFRDREPQPPQEPDNYAEGYYLETVMHVADYLQTAQDMTVATAVSSDRPGGEEYTGDPTYYYSESSEDFPHRISYPPESVPINVVQQWSVFDEESQSYRGAVENILQAFNGQDFFTEDYEQDDRGLGIAVVRGEGALHYLTPPVFGDNEVVRSADDPTDKDYLANAGRTPVVLSFAPDTGGVADSDPPDVRLPETLLGRGNQEVDGYRSGAVGVMAPNQLCGCSGYDDLLLHGTLTGFWPDYDQQRDPHEVHTNPYPHSMRPAEAMNFGKYYMGFYERFDSQYVEPQFNGYMWYGDPEMMFRTDTPVGLTLSSEPDVITIQGVHNATEELGVWKPSDLTITVSNDAQDPVEDALVCISKGTYSWTEFEVGDGLEPVYHGSQDQDHWAGTTDASGRVTFRGLTPHELGTYNIVVSAHNAIPIEGSIESDEVGDPPKDPLVIHADFLNEDPEEQIYRDNGDPDEFELSRNAAGELVIEITHQCDPPQMQVGTRAYSQFDRILVEGSGDDDTLIVDLTTAGTFPAGGIGFEGGEPESGDNDSLGVQKDGTISDVVYGITEVRTGYLAVGPDGAIAFRGLDAQQPLKIEAAGGTLEMDGSLEIVFSDHLRHEVDLLGEPAGGMITVCLWGQEAEDDTVADLQLPVPDGKITVSFGDHDDGVSIQASFHPLIEVNGGGGKNTLWDLDGSEGNDTLRANAAYTYPPQPGYVCADEQGQPTNYATRPYLELLNDEEDEVTDFSIVVRDFDYIGLYDRQTHTWMDGIDAGDGHDRAELAGSIGDEHLKVDANGATLSSELQVGIARGNKGWVFHLNNFEDLVVDSQQGVDSAELADSAGDDTLTAYPDKVVMTLGDGRTITLDDFNAVQVCADEGGNDTAHLSGSIGDDLLRKDWDWAELSELSGTGWSILVEQFDTVYVHASGGGLQVMGDPEGFALNFVGLFWDEQADGQWDYIDPQTQNSRWLDWDDDTVDVYPDDVDTDAVTRSNVVTVAEDALARDVTVESGSLVISTEATLSAAGRFQMGEGATYECQIGSSVGESIVYPEWPERPYFTEFINGSVNVSGNDAYLDGELKLTALDKLAPRHPLTEGGANMVEWRGDQTREILTAGGSSTILCAFASVPQSQPEVWYIEDVVDPETEEIIHERNWEQGHLRYGVFLTRLGDWGANLLEPPDPLQPGLSYSEDATQVHLFQGCDGDTNGNRYLDSLDFQNILGYGEYRTGVPCTWPEGDFNGHQDPDDPDLPPGAAPSIGYCDSYDIQLILATNLWPPSDPPECYCDPPEGGGGEGGGGGQAAAGAEGGGGLDAGDSVAELIVTPKGLYVQTNGLGLTSFIISSQSGMFTGHTAIQPSAALDGSAELLERFRVDTNDEISSAFFRLDGEHFLGDVIGQQPRGVDVLKDLAMTYTVDGRPGIFEGHVIVNLGVDEVLAEGAGPAGAPAADGSDPAADLLGWLYQFEPTAPQQHSSEPSDPAKAAVDLLLTADAV